LDELKDICQRMNTVLTCSLVNVPFRNFVAGKEFIPNQSIARETFPQENAFAMYKALFITNHVHISNYTC